MFLCGRPAGTINLGSCCCLRSHTEQSSLLPRFAKTNALPCGCRRQAPASHYYSALAHAGPNVPPLLPVTGAAAAAATAAVAAAGDAAAATAAVHSRYRRLSPVSFRPPFQCARR
ncbi:unnamed protein product, partial [Phaeothamnion confervicola]